LDRSLALGAFGARPIGLSAGRRCHDVLFGARFHHLIKGGCFVRCFVWHYPDEYPPLRLVDVSFGVLFGIIPMNIHPFGWLMSWAMFGLPLSR
jgi:hypothetical protein